MDVVGRKETSVFRRNMAKHRTGRVCLPPDLKEFFWDCDFARLSWQKHREFIMVRLLAQGTWQAIRWLRGKVTDRVLRALIIRRQGRGLDSQQLRFWELALGLPRCKVNAWLRDPVRRIWEDRTRL